MGEWSDYFEDFPDENPANWVEPGFDKNLDLALRNRQAKIAQKNANLRKTIDRMIAEAKKKQAKAK